MNLQLKVIWYLLNLCAIGFAWSVGGSAGFSIFPSKETFSAFPPVEEQKLSYIPTAAPFSNGSAVQPPLTSHPFESSPPGPKNIQPLPPQLPNNDNVSPTQSVAEAPHYKSPGPDASIKVSPSKEPPSSATPPPDVPLHDLAPQNQAQVYAPPPVAVLPDVPTLPHKPPVVAPAYASASPQASISTHASSPVSTSVSSHSSTPPPQAMPSPVTVPPHPSTIPPIAKPTAVFVPPPPEKPAVLAPPPTHTPYVSAPPPNSTLTKHSSTQSPPAPMQKSNPPPDGVPPIVSSSPPKAAPSHAPPPTHMPYVSAPPPNATISEHSSTPPPPISPIHVYPPPHGVPPIVSPPPPDAAPSHVLAPSPPAETHFTAPYATPKPRVSSHSSTPPPQAMPSPVTVPPHPSTIPPIAEPTAVFVPPPPEKPAVLAPPPTHTPYVSAPPPNSTLTKHSSTQSPPAPMHESNPPPDGVPPIVSSSPPKAAPSHAPPPTQMPYVSAPPPNATISEHSSTPPPPISPIHVYPPPHGVPPIVSPPPPDAAPSHVLAPSPPAETHFTAPYATPKPRVSSHSSTPPPQAMPSPVTVPPHPSTIPPIAKPTAVFVPPPPEKPDVLAPPPTHTPYVSAPPPNSTLTKHSSTQSPPAPMHESNPPPDGVPPIVSSSPPKAAPSHAPPPTHMPYVSAPPPNATISEHSSTPPPRISPIHVYPSPHGVPPIVSPPPPDAGPSHVLAPSPPAETHFTAPPPSIMPPPTHMPYISAPPPNATISEHSSAPPPPISPIHAYPPPHGVPPIVSPPPPAPSHVLAPSPPAETHFTAPPPSSMHYFSTPPNSPPASKNASYPPSASVTPHASAPSTAAEPPLAASPPSAHTVTPGSLPPVAYPRTKPKSQLSPVPSNSSAPLVAPPVRSPSIIPVVPREPPSIPPEAQLPRVSSPSPSIHQRGGKVPVIVAPSGPTYSLSPTSSHPEQGFSPYIAPTVHKSRGLPSLAPVATISPSISPSAEVARSPSLSPLPSTSKAHPRNGSSSVPETSYTVPSPAPRQHVESPSYSVLSPAPESAPTSHHPGSSAAMAPSHSPSTEDYISPVPMSTIPIQSAPSMTPFLSPKISPSESSTKTPELAPPILALPPPPPNRDCLSFTCLEPYTNTIAGSPCGCVIPMKVELRIGVALYTFFPLVPELAREVATGIFMKQSQVRIMGANAASEQPDKTLLLIDLVPLGDKFDNITAFLIFERFWNKQVAISESLFGDYEVLYVQYPGLPPSPPMAPSDVAAINGPFPGDNGSKIHPLGVDVSKQGRKHRLSGSLIAIIVFSAVGAVLLCFLLGWILLFRHRRQVNQSAEAPHVYPASIARSTGPTGQSAGSRPSFSLSFESSVAAYTGSAKTFSAGEIEKATDNFNDSRVLGEGGFGRVYSGVLEDGTEVAVKVLKREDQQGGREFLAEIEMLSRLHHRNLVKLIGMCVEEHVRCLVYELIPNGSVESHLHGVDGQASPLDWSTRMKIALGAARGLAYLHEDSSPRVIHRDFKASNILLEADFTPKVSDFGLARTAMDEENRHVSTRVMGTFGYVAPEYAMTGHLLVKSDVYSYGVVLLELLTGRKPVDMSQPAGQENLVAWTRPYLTSKEALKSIVDTNLGLDISFDSVANVAAIASMCVQPEVSHRPFMGEVVQALKLVCNECDGAKDEGEDENSSTEARDPLQCRYSAHSYGSGGNVEDLEKGLSASDLFSATDTRMGCKESESSRRYSSSGPIGGGRSWRFWKRARTTSSREAVGEHGMYRFWSGSH